MNQRLTKLRELLGNAEQNAHFFQKRISEYLLQEDTPPVLISNESQWKAEAARLQAEIARLEQEATPPPAPLDRVRRLLNAGHWEAVIDELRPRVAAGDDAALLLLAELPERVAVPLALRLEAARLLGARDPRLLNPETGDNRFGTSWCPVEAGPFWYGDDSGAFNWSKEELRRVRLDYGYRIGRYPVTNAEYARFIAARGYQIKRWWTPHGWEDIRGGADAKVQPRLWKDERFNAPTQPVVSLSWYEAVAYCRWLTEQGHAAGWLPVGEALRLPTSLEWERAARHTDQRPYPWGTAEPTPEQANYKETGIGLPSPVGCFPAGAAVCGALDMSGNVWEWTATPCKQPGQAMVKEDFTPSDLVVLRGGSWSNGTSKQMCVSRFRYNASSRITYQGMRLVRSLRSSRE